MDEKTINDYLNSVIATVKENYGNNGVIKPNTTITITIKEDDIIYNTGFSLSKNKKGKDAIQEYEKDFKLTTVKPNFTQEKVTKAKNIYVSMKVIQGIINSKKDISSLFSLTFIDTITDENDKLTLRTKFLYDIQLELMKQYSEKVAEYLTPSPPAASGTTGAAEGGSSDKKKKDKKKKVKGGFIDLDYDTQKMYNAQGLITELASLNAPSGNMNLNQPDPFSASGPSAGTAFESLPPNMIAGLTPSFAGGAKKKNLKH